MREELDLTPFMSHPHGSTYVLRMKGNSMLAENIVNGDYVIIDRRQIPKERDLVICFIDGDTLSLRRFSGQTNIQGVVIGVLRSYLPKAEGRP